MHPRPCSTSVLFCLALSAASFAPAQTCAVELRHAAARQNAHTVSAHDLQIPSRAWQHFDKARAASEGNQAEIVARESMRALVIAPRFPQVYLLRAAQEVRTGHYDTALATIVTAREIAPDVPWSSIVAAGALNQLRRFDRAIAELDRARGPEAESWQAHYERARAEIGRGNLSAALDASDRAIATAPTGCTESRILRANALELAGRETEALAELRTYLTEDRQAARQGSRLEALRAQIAARIARAGESTQADQTALVAMR